MNYILKIKFYPMSKYFNPLDLVIDLIDDEVSVVIHSVVDMSGNVRSYICSSSFKDCHDISQGIRMMCV
jgi:hypothetical protein